MAPAAFGGSSTVIGLFYLEKTTGTYRWLSATAIGARLRDQGGVRDSAGNVLQGNRSPALAPWPIPGGSRIAQSTACGIFADTGNLVRFYC